MPHLETITSSKLDELGEQMASVDLSCLSEQRCLIDSPSARIFHDISKGDGLDVAPNSFTDDREHCQIDKAREFGGEFGVTDCSASPREHEILGLDPSAFVEPYSEYKSTGNAKWKELGASALSDGKVGCILIAGGLGTRLGSDLPKGMFPVSVTGKTLFQMVSERTVAASRFAGSLLPLAIMTSPQNDRVVRDYFKKNKNFGLENSQLFFFVQTELPLLDQKGELFLETPQKLAVGPDGNGHTFKHFYRAGILKEWKKRGIETINVILVQNPLANPFDVELIGYHLDSGSQITNKAILRSDPHEKVGCFIRENGRVTVREYSEFSDSEKEECNENGSLKHICANLSLFCIAVPFLEKMSAEIDLPLHKSWKAARYLTKKGESVQSKEPIAWKFERFIFDLFPYAQSLQTLVYPREECFAPLKNASGQDSPETVKEALFQRDRRQYTKISGLLAPNFPFELTAEFFYPTLSLLERWKGRSIDHPGIVNS